MSLENIQKIMHESQLKIKKAVNEAKELAKNAFKEGSAILFEEFPLLAGFSWRQYTPYFQDGDECIFSVHSDYPSVWYADKEFNEDEDYEGDYEFSDYMYKDKTDPKYIVGKAVRDFLRNFDTDLMRSMFGDHCKITITKDKVDVEHYEHE